MDINIINPQTKAVETSLKIKYPKIPNIAPKPNPFIIFSTTIFPPYFTQYNKILYHIFRDITTAFLEFHTKIRETAEAISLIYVIFKNKFSKISC